MDSLPLDDSIFTAAVKTFGRGILAMRSEDDTTPLPDWIEALGISDRPPKNFVFKIKFTKNTETLTLWLSDQSTYDRNLSSSCDTTDLPIAPI